MICDNENCLKVFVAEMLQWDSVIEGCLLRAAAARGIPPVESRHDDSSGTDEMMKLVNLQRLAADLEADGVWIN